MEKSQAVRLMDVWALGPWLVMLSLLSRPLRPWEKRVLLGVGIATILYNGRNYLLNTSGAGKDFDA